MMLNKKTKKFTMDIEFNKLRETISHLGHLASNNHKSIQTNYDICRKKLIQIAIEQQLDYADMMREHEELLEIAKIGSFSHGISKKKSTLYKLLNKAKKFKNQKTKFSSCTREALKMLREIIEALENTLKSISNNEYHEAKIKEFLAKYDEDKKKLMEDIITQMEELYIHQKNFINAQRGFFDNFNNYQKIINDLKMRLDEILNTIQKLTKENEKIIIKIEQNKIKIRECEEQIQESQGKIVTLTKQLATTRKETYLQHFSTMQTNGFISTPELQAFLSLTERFHINGGFAVLDKSEEAIVEDHKSYVMQNTSEIIAESIARKDQLYALLLQTLSRTTQPFHKKIQGLNSIVAGLKKTIHECTTSNNASTAQSRKNAQEIEHLAAEMESIKDRALRTKTEAENNNVPLTTEELQKTAFEITIQAKQKITTLKLDNLSEYEEDDFDLKP
jgi:chromosome segregation ATPase